MGDLHCTRLSKRLRDKMDVQKSLSGAGALSKHNRVTKKSQLQTRQAECSKRGLLATESAKLSRGTKPVPLGVATQNLARQTRFSTRLNPRNKETNEIKASACTDDKIVMARAQSSSTVGSVQCNCIKTRLKSGEECTKCSNKENGELSAETGRIGSSAKSKLLIQPEKEKEVGKEGHDISVQKCKAKCPTVVTSTRNKTKKVRGSHHFKARSTNFDSASQAERQVSVEKKSGKLLKGTAKNSSSKKDQPERLKTAENNSSHNLPAKTRKRTDTRFKLGVVSDKKVELCPVYNTSENQSRECSQLQITTRSQTKQSRGGAINMNVHRKAETSQSSGMTESDVSHKDDASFSHSLKSDSEEELNSQNEDKNKLPDKDQKELHPLPNMNERETKSVTQKGVGARMTRSVKKVEEERKENNKKEKQVGSRISHGENSDMSSDHSHAQQGNKTLNADEVLIQESTAKDKVFQKRILKNDDVILETKKGTSSMKNTRSQKDSIQQRNQSESILLRKGLRNRPIVDEGSEALTSNQPLGKRFSTQSLTLKEVETCDKSYMEDKTKSQGLSAPTEDKEVAVQVNPMSEANVNGEGVDTTETLKSNSENTDETEAEGSNEISSQDEAVKRIIENPCENNLIIEREIKVEPKEISGDNEDYMGAENQTIDQNKQIKSEDGSAAEYLQRTDSKESGEMEQKSRVQDEDQNNTRQQGTVSRKIERQGTARKEGASSSQVPQEDVSVKSGGSKPSVLHDGLHIVPPDAEIIQYHCGNGRATKDGSPERGKKMLAKTKTGQLVQINYDEDRPETFQTEKARIWWDMAVAKNAMRLKHQIESGEYIPDDIHDKIKKQMHIKEEEREQMKKEKRLEKKKSKLRPEHKGDRSRAVTGLQWLKIEARIVEIDALIKANLSMRNADCDRCLLLMDELAQLSIAPLMLKKHPEVVETMKKLRRYVGNIKEWNMTEEEEVLFTSKAEKIRTRATFIYNKFKTFFTVPEGRTFWTVFADDVTEFRNVTQDMKPDEVFALVFDPTFKEGKHARSSPGIQSEEEGTKDKEGEKPLNGDKDADVGDDLSDSRHSNPDKVVKKRGRPRKTPVAPTEAATEENKKR